MKSLLAFLAITMGAALAGSALAISVIGDAVAPRTAVMAIYEGRKRGMTV